MADSTDSREMQRLLDSLNKNIQQLARNIGAGSKGGAGGSDGGANKQGQSQANKATRDLSKSLRDLNSQAVSTKKLMQGFGSALENSSQILNDLNKEYNRLHNYTAAQGSATVDAVAATKKISKGFSSAADGSDQISAQFSGMVQSIKTLDQNMLGAAGIISTNAQDLQQGFGAGAAALGATLVSGEQTALDTFDQLGKLGKAAKKLRKALEASLSSAQPPAGGGGAGGSGPPAGQLLLVTNRILSSINDRLGYLQGIHKFTDANADYTWSIMSFFTTGRLVDQLVEANASAGGGGGGGGRDGGGLKKIIAAGKEIIGALKGPFDEIQKFNTANIATSFADLKATSVSLGMSFEDTMKYFEANKGILAQYGPDKFAALTNGVAENLSHLGYTSQASAKMMAASIGTANAAMVNQRDAKAMNNFITDSATSFQRLASISNITMEEFQKLNTELYSSQEVQATLLGMSDQQAEAYRKSLTSERERLVTAGLTNQQAQDLIKLNESQKKAKVSDKVKAVAALSMQASAAGLDAGRMSQLALKQRTGQLSPEEQKEYQGMLAAIAKSQAEQQQAANEQGAGASLAMQASIDAMRGISSGATEQIEKAQQLAATEKAGMGRTKGEVEAAVEAAKGSKAIADLGTKADQASAIMNDKFVGALLTASSALSGLSASALGAGAGGGGGGGAGLGAAARFAGGATLVAGAAYAGWQVGGMINEAVESNTGDSIGGHIYDYFHPESEFQAKQKAEEDKQALALAQKRLDSGGQVAQYQADLLRAKGIQVANDRIRQPGAAPAATPIAAVTTTGTPAAVLPPAASTADNALNVNDRTAQTSLGTLNENMAAAVAILRQIADKGLIVGGINNSTTGNKIPTVPQAITAPR